MRRSLAVLLFAPCFAHAQWGTNLTLNTRVCDIEATQFHPTACIDGAGGSFHAWSDNRVMGEPALFIQHLNAAGERLWENDGVLVRNGGSSANLLADGAGGVWVVHLGPAFWQMNVQHVSATGELLLGPNGMPVLSAQGISNWPSLLPDGAGGVLVATAVQNVPANAVVVQRIKNDGQILWGAAGAGFATGNNNCDYRMRVVQGDSASMIMLWGDLEHRLQRVDTSGNFRWGPQGVVVGAAADCYALRRLCSDGAGGAYTLTLPQNTNQPEAFLQRVLANGTLAWPVPGVALGETGFSIGDMDLSADGSGGAFVITRLNSSFELRVRVQHVNAQGEVTNTVLLYSGGIQAGVNCALGTAVNGVVPAVWYLHPPGNRLGKFQRIATNGSMQWPASIDIYDSGGSPQSMNDLKILSHADGAQTFSWFDTRYASPTSKVYAHHVTADQSAGIADLVPAERFAHPVPTSDQLLIDLPGEAGSEWQLRTAAGAVVASGRLGSGAGSIDLGHVTNGCYVLNVRTSIGQRTQRVVVAR